LEPNDVNSYPALLRKLSPEEGDGWLVEYIDLPGCMGAGDTPEQALRNGDAAVEEWIAAAREMGRPIPEPNALDQFSGKWVQRVPKSLHRKLAEAAKREGVSLNHLAAVLLAEGIGRKTAA
jgi:antitoxin HicB